MNEEMILFSQASVTSLEKECVLDAMNQNILSGDGKYTQKVYEQFLLYFGIKHMLLTTSGTSALELAALLIDIKPGDEIIVPSFTFSSTANAFMLRGAIPVFCDMRPDTMNMDETRIEALITKKTRAIYTVDYAGVPCEMDTIKAIARHYGLFVIEDAAQAVGSYYKGKPAGTLGEFGCFSFHATKNYIMGEGGALVLNEEKYLERAEIIREKGTNRNQLIRGVVDKYTWHEIGSSYLPSDILAALLYAQMERFQEITQKRLMLWNLYQEQLETLEKKEKLRRPSIPKHIEHNGHMYNIVLPTADIRSKTIDQLRQQGIQAPFCYVPLHSSPLGKSLGHHEQDCPITEDYGARVLRLPLHFNMIENDVYNVCEQLDRILCD